MNLPFFYSEIQIKALSLNLMLASLGHWGVKNSVHVHWNCLISLAKVIMHLLTYNQPLVIYIDECSSMAVIITWMRVQTLPTVTSYWFSTILTGSFIRGICVVNAELLSGISTSTLDLKIWYYKIKKHWSPFWRHVCISRTKFVQCYQKQLQCIKIALIKIWVANSEWIVP